MEIFNAQEYSFSRLIKNGVTVLDAGEHDIPCLHIEITTDHLLQ